MLLFETLFLYAPAIVGNIATSGIASAIDVGAIAENSTYYLWRY